MNETIGRTWWSISEVAAYLDMSRGSVHGWVADGNLIAHNRGKGKINPVWYVHYNDLQTFIASRGGTHNVRQRRKGKRRSYSVITSWRHQSAQHDGDLAGAFCEVMRGLEQVEVVA